MTSDRVDEEANDADISHPTTTRKARRHKKAETYSNYIYKIFRKDNQIDLRISKKAMNVVNSFMTDMFEKISNEAFHLCKLKHRTTLSESEIDKAAKLVLPEELYREASEKYQKALKKYLAALAEAAEEKEQMGAMDSRAGDV